MLFTNVLIGIDKTSGTITKSDGQGCNGILEAIRKNDGHYILWLNV